MTQMWPNDRAAMASREIDQTSNEPNAKELIHGHLAHAQVMIGYGIFQVTVLVMRSGGDAVGRVDYDKFSNAYEFAMFSINSSVIITAGLYVLVWWIIWTSRQHSLMPHVHEAISPFTKTNPKQWRRFMFFLVFAAALLLALFGLSWLRAEELIPNGLYAAGIDVFSILMAVNCFVYAVFQIRHALKIMMKDNVA